MTDSDNTTTTTTDSEPTAPAEENAEEPAEDSAGSTGGDGDGDGVFEDDHPPEAPFDEETDAAFGDRARDGASDLRERAERAGRALGNGVNKTRVGASKVWTGVLYGVTSALGTDKVWQNRFKKNMKRMYKATSADAIGFVAQKNGSILPTPVKYRPPDIDDEEHPHGYWEAGHMDQTFTAATGANATETINNIPVVFLHTDDWAESSFSGALLAEAVDLGKTDALYENPTLNVVEVAKQPPQATGDSADAVADGGGVVKRQSRVENLTPGALKDVAVDVESVGRHNGTRVQWEKFKDLRMEQTTVEEMNQTQERGRLAGLREAMTDDNKHMVKWFVLGMVALGLGAFYLGAKFGGGGGGGGGGDGGGGVMPLLVTMDSMFQTATAGVGWL